MATKIAVMNQKGGVGKTTCVFNIATMLKGLGHKVLISDLDHQNDQIKIAPIKARADREKSFVGILLKGYKCSECITTLGDNLDLIQSGGKSLENFSIKYKGQPNESIILSEKLKELENEYDYIIIDSNPTFSLIHQNILQYADYILTPTDLDNLSLSATRSTIHLIENLSKRLGIKELKIGQFLGVIPIRFNSRRNLDNVIMDDFYSLEDNNLLLGGIIFQPIRESSKLKTAIAKRKTLKQAFPNEKVTHEIEAVAKEIVNQVNKRKKCDKNTSPAEIERTM